MDTSNLSMNQLAYIYEHGDHQLRGQATARMSAIQQSDYMRKREVTGLSSEHKTEARTSSEFQSPQEVSE